MVGLLSLGLPDFWKFIFLTMSLMALPLYYFSKAGYDTFYYMVPAIVFMQIYLCRALKNVPVFLLLTIYAFFYFIYLYPYFYYDMQLSMWTEFQRKALFLQVCLQFYVFYSAICLSVGDSINEKKRWLKDGLSIKVSPLIAEMFLLFTALIIVYLFKYGGSNVLGESNPYIAYTENLGKSNVMGLLVVMCVAFCYMVMKPGKARTIIILGYSILIAYYAVTRGFRVMLAPLGFLFIMLFLEQKLSVKSILAIAVIGLIGLGYLNALKMNEEFSLMYVFSTNDYFILSHQADELYGAAVANGLVDNGEISFWDRISLQIGLLCQSIVPPSFFPDTMRFPKVLMVYTGTGGGGLFVSGLWLIFGYIGLFFLTYILSKFIQKGYSTQSRYIRLIVFIVLMFVPNWFSYDLNVILRFPVIGVILYFLLQKIKWPKVQWRVSW